MLWLLVVRLFGFEVFVDDSLVAPVVAVLLKLKNKHLQCDWEQNTNISDNIEAGDPNKRVASLVPRDRVINKVRKHEQVVDTHHDSHLIKIFHPPIARQTLRRNIAENNHDQHADNHLQLNLEPGIIGTEHDKQNLGKSSIAVDSDEVGTVFTPMT